MLGDAGEIIFSSRGNDCLLQWKFLHGNFQGRRNEGKNSLLFISERRDLQSEWFIQCIPEYALNSANVKPIIAIG